MAVAEPEPEIAPGRCPFHPLARRPLCKEGPALAFAADVVALTLHWKLRDDMADENGFITYHGVTFYCDKDNNQLTLGDVSNPANTITVPLEAGGSLVFNRENIGGLSRAITMFSGEDVRRIMTAIAQDAQCARKQNEIEELETKVGTKPEEAE